MFFQPYRDYIATRQIYNERDFGQKYVKLWIRDANTDEALLDGVEMDESSDEVGRFKYTYKMPGDPTGNGRQLRVITVVYSDSGYTERDLNYQVEETNVVVRDMNMLGGGGGGTDIDYKKIEEMIKAEISTIKLPEDQDLSFITNDIKDAQKSISSEIKAIKIPEVSLDSIKKSITSFENILKNIISNFDKNVSSVKEKIDDVEISVIDRVDNIKFPEPPKRDMIELISIIILLKRTLSDSRLENLLDKDNYHELKEILIDLENDMKIKQTKSLEEINNIIKELKVIPKINKTMTDVLETLDNIEDKI